MYYSGIKWTDTANGVGIRLTLFVSGCPHACAGCFNQEAWDFQAGEEFTPEIREKILSKLGESYLRGLSLLGGEPLAPENQEEVLSFLCEAKERFPEKDIWCYTGYEYEEILSGSLGENGKAILSYVDILVDGLFLEEKKNISLRFRGSENQRIINVPKSLKSNTVIFW
ncbi:MAG: anaerobic ribonucleoside-triphosphate reductase activating protein [Eubacteriales bacterium]